MINAFYRSFLRWSYFFLKIENLEPSHCFSRQRPWNEGFNLRRSPWGADLHNAPIWARALIGNGIKLRSLYKRTESQVKHFQVETKTQSEITFTWSSPRLKDTEYKCSKVNLLSFYTSPLFCNRRKYKRNGKDSKQRVY